MKKNLPMKLLSIILLISLFGCASTQTVKQVSESDDSAVLTAIRLEENSIIIKSNKHFSYTVNKGNDPYRASIEMPDMNLGQYTSSIHSDIGAVTEVIPQRFDSPKAVAKIDVVLQTPSLLMPEYGDNTLVITIMKDVQTIQSEVKEEEAARPIVRLVAEEKPSEKAASPQAPAVPTAKATEINGIELKKQADTLKILITGNGSMIPNVFPVNERIVVDIPDAVLRAVLPAQTIAPLKSIRAGKHKDKLRIVLDLREKTNFDVTAIGNTIEISLVSKDAQTQAKETSSPPLAVNPASETATAAMQTPAKEAPDPVLASDGTFTGKKISLDFQDADIVPIFRLLGDISGYNIVVNPEVKGKITLKLINVPWDQALDVILRTFQLAKIVDGSIMRIVPNATVAKELDDIKAAKKATAEAGDLKTKIFPVNYADLNKLRDAIDKAKLLSSRGSISIDERGSSIIVNDLDLNIEKIAELIKELDQEQMQARQVLIEARVVEVNTDYTKALGVQWGAFFANPPTTGNNNFLINDVGSGTVTPLTSTGVPAISPLVNLPASDIAGRIGFGYINKAATFALNLQLSAMEQTKNGKILSSPKVMTMNNEPAKIVSGRQLQLPTTDKDGKQTLTAIPLNLELDVTPRIAPGGSILMKVTIKKDELIDFIVAGTSVGADTTKNEINTTVLINDGATLVIGGIHKSNESEGEKGIPGLRKLPLIGLLFKNESVRNTSNETLVFLTPRIVDINMNK